MLLVVVSDLLASLLFLGASFRLARLTTRQSQLIKSSRSDSNPLGRNAQNEQNVNGAQVQGTDDAFGGLADARKCLVGVIVDVCSGFAIRFAGRSHPNVESHAQFSTALQSLTHSVCRLKYWYMQYRKVTGTVCLPYFLTSRQLLYVQYLLFWTFPTKVVLSRSGTFVRT